MRAKHFVPIVEAQQELFEVNMSPGNLKRLASDVDASVGIEFEMIVPNVGSVDGDDDYYEPEEDMDYDEEAYDIDDIVRFFNYGDYNDRSTIRVLEEELKEKFYEWQAEQILDQWKGEEGKAYFADWVKNNVDPDEVAEFAETPEDLFGEKNPSKEDYEKFIEDQWDTEGSYYDEAYDMFREERQDDGDFDEREFLRDIGIRYMSDVNDRVREYVGWPHWTYPEGDGNGEANLEELADEFSDAIGRKVYYSTGYHSGPRTSNGYTIEPDSSLEDSEFKKNPDDAGLEFISPPLSVDEALSDVKKIKKWADERGAYTSEKTGLHMNISVPDFDPENLDYVKLTLLLGDKTILDKFGRLGNTYCQSAMDIIEQAPTIEQKEILFKKLKTNLEAIASKVIVGWGYSEVKFGPVTQRIGKFTSINPKDNRVEFRSPGGDWLGQNFDKIEETLYRCVVALDAACDPSKYRKEYLKKLTKMFAPTKGSIEDVFVQYQAGTITKEELKFKIKTAQAQRRQEKLSKEGVVELEFYNAKDGDYIIEYDNPTGDNYRIFLKRTEQVSDPNKALEAAMKLVPTWFKPDDIENIIVTEYSGNKDYAVIDNDGGLIGMFRALTPLQAIDIAMKYNENLPKNELTVKLASEYESPEDSGLENLGRSSRMAPGEELFLVKNTDTGHEVKIAAANGAQAIARASRNDPHNFQGGNSNSNITVTQLRRQPPAVQGTMGTPEPAFANPNAGMDSYIVSEPDGGGEVRFRANSPEHAIERARTAYNLPPERELVARLENG